jgi:hypothetical protein
MTDLAAPDELTDRIIQGRQLPIRNLGDLLLGGGCC